MKDNSLMRIEFENHKIPEFKEVKSKSWILYGEDNLYPNYLLELFNKSAKHNAIVTGKCNYIVGKGLTVNDEGLTDQQKALFNEFLLQPNGQESVNDLLPKIGLDLEVFGGIALEVIYGKASGKIAYVNHVDFSKVRSNPDGTEFYYAEDWSKSSPQNEEGFKTLPAFNPSKPSGAQLLYFKQYRPSLDAYPLPEYIGAIPYIEIDYEIANFHLNNIKNNFWGSWLINFFNGEPPEEKKKEIEKKFKKKAGTDNAGKFLLNFANSKEQAAELLALTPSDLDKQFEILNKTVQQEIFTGHKVSSPMLFGIKTEGQLGGRTELIEANELFKNTYINNKQQIIEKIFNELAKVNGFENRLSIIPTDPIGEQFSETVLIGLMTKDEARERAGLPQLQVVENDSSKISDALNALSPLVATKVINNMTPNEIRALISLTPIVGGDIIPEEEEETFKAQFKSDKDLVQIFSKYGESSENFEVIKKKRAQFNSTYHAAAFENVLEGDINDFAGKVLKHIAKNPKITSEELAKALKVDVKKVDKAIKDLFEAGHLMEKKDQMLPTDSGRDIIKDIPEVTDIFIMYEYVLRPEATGDLIIDTTREFCRDILAGNKKYSRKDIENVSQEYGYDVFSMTGGFWNKNGTIKPHCRHEWEMQVVRRKK